MSKYNVSLSHVVTTRTYSTQTQVSYTQILHILIQTQIHFIKAVSQVFGNSG